MVSRYSKTPLFDGLDFDVVMFDCDGALTNVSKSMYLSVKLLPCTIFDAPYEVELRPGRGLTR